MVTAELGPRPVGFSTVVRMPQKFVPYGYAPTLAVIVQKEPDGYRWREYTPAAFHRKGFTQPQLRPL
jgi:hypothetical protein